MSQKKLLMISTDRAIFQEGSAVRARQAEYAKGWEEVHIIIFDKKVTSSKSQVTSRKSAGADEVYSTATYDSQIETVIAPNCWAYSTASRTKFMYPFDAMKLGRFLVARRGITDITCQDPFLTAMAGVALKKQFPLVNLELQVHTDIGSPNFTYTFGNKMRKFLALNYLPKADHVRVVSERIKKWIQDAGSISRSSISGNGDANGNEARIEVRPIFVDVEKIKAAPVIAGADLHDKYPQFDKIVLMASRLEREKNVDLAIEAWSKVIERNPKAGLIIVGSGSELSTLKSLALRLNLKAGVIFENWVDQATLYSYYKTADLFLNTSLFEGYGMTLVEAHAAECKIVSTDVGVAREVGAVVTEAHPEALAQAIITTLA